MKKIIIFCSGAMHLKKTFKKGKFSIAENIVEFFPDGELRQRFSGKARLKNKSVFIVQSFYRDKKFSINDRIFEAISAYHNAKSLGAKKIYLIAPYFPYLREDKRFEANEAITARIMAQIFKVYDKVFIFEPHLHRFKKFSEFFPNAKRVALEDFTKNEIAKFAGKDVLLIGPDQESETWVKPIVKHTGVDSMILKKTRLSPEKVMVKLNCKAKYKKIILIDDIASTGRTLLECVKKLKCKKVYCFVFHGLFINKSVADALVKYGRIYSANTIPVNQKGVRVIDISGKIKEIVESN